MRVAYFLASFPNTSETFIINEVSEVMRQGMEARIFSILRPSTPCPHPGAKALANRVEYLPPLDDVPLSKLLLVHIFFLIEHPCNYLRALLFVLMHRENAMLWTFKVSVICANHIRNFMPTHIHTHFAYDSCRLAMVISKVLGIPFTLTIHGWGDLYGHPPSDLKLIMLEAKHTVTVCGYNKFHILNTYAIHPSRITVIRCGIPDHYFVSHANGGREPGLIVSVGRLHYHKAYHVLIDACKLLSDRDVPFHCRIVGQGELREELQKQIDFLHLGSKVQLIGGRSNDQVKDLLLRAHVFAMSSVVETVGLACVEALASQTPVVATRVYGVPEMVRDRETGLLCAPGDPACIANALETLLSEAGLGKSMGARGRLVTSKEHSLQIQVAKLINVFTQ